MTELRGRQETEGLETPTQTERRSSQDSPQLRPAAPHRRPLWPSCRTAASSLLTNKLILSLI